MPDPAQIHAASLAQLEAWYGPACPTFQWPVGAAPLPCMAGTADYMLKLGVGGFGADNDLVLIARLAIFVGPLPQPEQTLLYVPNGKRYRISEVQTPMGSPFLRMSLIDLSKGV